MNRTRQVPKIHVIEPPEYTVDNITQGTHLSPYVSHAILSHTMWLKRTLQTEVWAAATIKILMI